MKKISRFLAAALCLALLAGCLCGCAKNPAPAEVVSDPASSVVAPPQKAKVRVLAISGPTGMGMVELMQANDEGRAANDYTFTLTTNPSDAVAKLTSGETDIAAIPANLAATLYAKTQGGIQILALNTQNNLYIVQTGEEVSSIASLEGKTIAVSGQGSTPEYILNYILSANDLADKVTIHFYAEHSEVVAKLAAGEETIALLPQPFVSVAQKKMENLSIAVNMETAWEDACKKTGSTADIAMGCVVARREFIEQNTAAVQSFLAEYLNSIGYVSTNTKEAAKLVVQYGILPDEGLAEAALPSCGIAFLSGATMRDSLKPFLEILYAANPAAVGGALPGEDFYYLP